jgi:cysteine dioxygenase
MKARARLRPSRGCSPHRLARRRYLDGRKRFFYVLNQSRLMELTLEGFFAELDGFAARIPLVVLTRRLKELQVDFAEIARYAQFSPDRYRRNLLRAGPAYHALVLCWRHGQRSPIHDHRGSACGVLVLRGEATETVFAMTGHDHVYATGSWRLTGGFIAATQDADIHQISNLHPAKADLITLHIYSPPLLVMGQYSLTDPLMREFHDEVCAFTEGGGI